MFSSLESWEEDKQPVSGTHSVISPLRGYYEANIYRMSADMQKLFRDHFTGQLIARITKVLKPITAEEAQDLRWIICNTPAIESVTFDGNHLGPANLSTLLFSLELLPRLSMLRISNNDLADEGAAVLAMTIPKLKALQDLLVYENHIGDKGAKKLGKALAGCEQILQLDVSKNVIGLEGAQRLIAGALKCPSLKLLKLSSNRFDPASLTTDKIPFTLISK